MRDRAARVDSVAPPRWQISRARSYRGFRRRSFAAAFLVRENAKHAEVARPNDVSVAVLLLPRNAPPVGKLAERVRAKLALQFSLDRALGKLEPLFPGLHFG